MQLQVQERTQTTNQGIIYNDNVSQESIILLFQQKLPTSVDIPQCEIFLLQKFTLTLIQLNKVGCS